MGSTKRHNFTKNCRQSAAVAVRVAMPDVSNWLNACVSKHGHLTKDIKHTKNTSPKSYGKAGCGSSLEIETLFRSLSNSKSCRSTCHTAWSSGGNMRVM